MSGEVWGGSPVAGQYEEGQYEEGPYEGPLRPIVPLKEFIKHDQDKPRFDLIPPEAELELAKVFTYGARKYSPQNFRIGTSWSRYVAAARRHLNAWQLGENVDPESGLLHLAQAAASILMLLVLQITGKGTDDRVKKV